MSNFRPASRCKELMNLLGWCDLPQTSYLHTWPWLPPPLLSLWRSRLKPAIGTKATRPMTTAEAAPVPEAKPVTVIRTPVVTTERKGRDEHALCVR